MAGEQITVAVTQVTEQRRGFMAISLDEWTTTNEPEITEGSRVEIQGALFKFPANEDIDASANWAGFGNSTQIYGYFVVAGANVTCELTTTAPTWSEEFQGWYDTATSTNRHWGKIYKDAGGNYTQKEIYLNRDQLVTNEGISLNTGANADHRIRLGTDANILWDESEDEINVDKPIICESGIETDGTRLKTKILSIGNWNMDTTISVSVAHGLTWTDIRSVNATIIGDATAGIWMLRGIDVLGNLGGQIEITAADIDLHRVTGGFFDNVAFNASPFNRGYITIIYEA